VLPQHKQCHYSLKDTKSEEAASLLAQFTVLGSGSGVRMETFSPPSLNAGLRTRAYFFICQYATFHSAESHGV
jgi:hypothetical protein